MRGKPKRLLVDSFGDRITPAHAGKTLLFLLNFRATTDHPRACGENGNTVSCSVPLSGSPPRMRGKLDGEEYELAEDRITPAYAGKTGKTSNQHIHARDHPRVCGED